MLSMNHHSPNLGEKVLGIPELSRKISSKYLSSGDPILQVGGGAAYTFGLHKKQLNVLTKYSIPILQTLMIKLDPSPEQYEALCSTMRRFNEACNSIAETVFDIHSANKNEIHKTVYYPIREEFGLSAQLTVRAIAKVAEAYMRDKSIKPQFRLDGAIVYDQRILSFKRLDLVSILTLQGRQFIPLRIGEYQKVRMDLGSEVNVT